VNLQTTFLFWPVRVVGVSDGWVYGTYSGLTSLPHRLLLESGRLRWGRRYRGVISEAQVEKSFRYHEALGVALEADRILLETGELDEQQFVESPALVSEQRAREALMAFVNLGYRNDDAAVGYIREFGDFHHLELDQDKFVGSGIPKLIQQFCKQQVQKRQDPFAVSLSHFWAVRDEIEGLWNLAIAVDQRDSQGAKGECIRRRPNSSFDPETDWLALGKAILCTDLSASLNPGKRNPRLILHEKEGKLVALTMGTTVKTALYLTLFDMIVSKTEYKRCPNCKKPFIATVKRKKFCTPVCQNAAKARRLRARRNENEKMETTIRGVAGMPRRL
jgi:hypothetical protein